MNSLQVFLYFQSIAVVYLGRGIVPVWCGGQPHVRLGPGGEQYIDYTQGQVFLLIGNGLTPSPDFILHPILTIEPFKSP